MKKSELNKIDFVMIWVDGNDPEWQAERNRYSGNSEKKDDDSVDARSLRYRDWDNLKYWFRAVEKYAGWVNKIHFVTWGHLPEWLNTDNPKLNIVNHKDFIPEEYLPTFSSHPIELNIHRIKGLAEQFVYFNDDVFLINSVEPSDFFMRGKPRDAAILSPAIMEDKNGIGIVELNNMAIINTHFDKNEVIKKNKKLWYNRKYEKKQLMKNYLLKPWNSFTSFYEFHVSSNFRKKTFEEIWDKEFEALDQTCRHRFRDIKLDNNQWLMRDWQLVSGNFIPRSTSFGKLHTLDIHTNVREALNDKKAKVICLNDSDEISDKEFETLKRRVIKAFEEKLGEKSSFEV